ncbi:hypothetical protein [Bdellovibrio reynosensis]|uniref:Lipoprotein n=1 Tax=Bdellovibrio reynosensis TaxID=2835041 RepID=A0ABY4C9M5_9BACT|nr:hypothetical protein [Bdellovibrio reynosensis]UOF01434.1 hypothetical protein MNR06_00515 [Bdellovibrio reynosensis]
MRFIGNLSVIFALLLTGCADVVPQVMMLRGLTPDEDTNTNSNKPQAQVELASHIETTSVNGYKLKAVVSKEDRSTVKTSSIGYKLILDSAAE